MSGHSCDLDDWVLSCCQDAATFGRSAINQSANVSGGIGDVVDLSLCVKYNCGAHSRKQRGPNAALTELFALAILLDVI
jgi:hypothetical protein